MAGCLESVRCVPASGWLPGSGCRCRAARTRDDARFTDPTSVTNAPLGCGVRASSCARLAAGGAASTSRSPCGRRRWRAAAHRQRPCCAPARARPARATIPRRRDPGVLARLLHLAGIEPPIAEPIMRGCGAASAWKVHVAAYYGGHCGRRPASPASFARHSCRRARRPRHPGRDVAQRLRHSGAMVVPRSDSERMHGHKLRVAATRATTRSKPAYASSVLYVAILGVLGLGFWSQPRRLAAPFSRIAQARSTVARDSSSSRCRSSRGESARSPRRHHMARTLAWREALRPTLAAAGGPQHSSDDATAGLTQALGVSPTRRRRRRVRISRRTDSMNGRRASRAASSRAPSPAPRCAISWATPKAAPSTTLGEAVQACAISCA